VPFLRLGTISLASTCGEGACRNAAPPRWGAQRP
jgi:hypothetical protein